eukprot:CAMPEP_0178712248 /NCGR_PEP_ID=MMETSP0699-20121125/18782_1 /TAXON_ID=265572 /ORGANISM="Extubocellulus spinifer, Strain CCMP396" /LENGTH=123 /DNA_ID=CAMNT_0020360989 /DNA_START=49 /DNA_END=417 /DNA_ORIENTATION=+
MCTTNVSDRTRSKTKAGANVKATAASRKSSSARVAVSAKQQRNVSATSGKSRVVSGQEHVPVVLDPKLLEVVVGFVLALLVPAIVSLNTCMRYDECLAVLGVGPLAFFTARLNFVAEAAQHRF